MPFHSMLFHCYVNEMPQRLKSCLYQLPYSKVGFIVVIWLKIAEPIDDVKWT